MKVIQVANCVFFESDGAGYSVLGLCQGLHEDGVDVELHALGVRSLFKKLPEYPYYGYRSRKRFGLPWDVGSSPEMLSGLCSAALRGDIMHTNGLWSFSNVYPVKAVSGSRCKLVVSPHGTLARWALRKGYWKKKVFGWLFQNEVLRRADMFHATSEKEYGEIRAAGYRQPVAIVPIGMILPEIESHVKEDAWRMRRVVFFGRLHKVKGVDRLVRAW